ncbi:hypothetical protein OIU76_018651 [Salix suchowensis]|nr:hypothetical protein OIU76_018651 [Salix suchowensis]KAJ6342819.1 hypothetical protein OIU78_010685 [Salix suchowensis]
MATLVAHCKRLDLHEKANGRLPSFLTLKRNPVHDDASSAFLPSNSFSSWRQLSNFVNFSSCSGFISCDGVFCC